jgi:hypothetical protein
MLHIPSKMLLAIETPYSEMGRGDLKVGDGKIVFIGGAPSLPISVVQIDLASSKWWELRKSNNLEIGYGYLSTGQQWNSQLKTVKQHTPSTTRLRTVILMGQPERNHHCWLRVMAAPPGRRQRHWILVFNSGPAAALASLM